MEAETRTAFQVYDSLPDPCPASSPPRITL